ncbi:aldo/keto reductase [Rhodococcus sp. IEGM 1307]|uniref:aldo/keto reductase n=1 Tax=Rhodococcus sp. IEGM 1307 TaxID=3047091 RepID=UPI0024B81AF3|nr:aldo/keto reductase [Rhodococcus sp. IEGM 1307]MDI9979596.1 aldo/keto reductase [Rhodococcus sp. IEGM 1307]
MSSNYRVLGRTGVRVSPLTLGTMNFGSYGRVSAADGAELIYRAVDAGINMIDTADVYSYTEAEEIVGNALANSGKRDDIVLATKFNRALDKDPNHRGNSRRWIKLAVEASLRRLKTDYIDIYYAHRPDEDTELEETIDALVDLVREGKIRYYGTSTFPSGQIVEAQWLGRSRGVRPTVEQPPYSILVRHSERDTLPTAMQYKLGTLVWSPLAGGWLSGHYRQAEKDPGWQRWKNPLRHDPELEVNKTKADVVRQLQAVADDAGLTLLQLAIGFVLEHPGVTSAIIGPRTVEQLLPYLDTPEIVLDNDTLDAIDEIVPPGVTLSPGDVGDIPPAIAQRKLRRRHYRKG